jgi:hypothetical protein
MKDPKDTKTRSLFVGSGAKYQAVFKGRMNDAGFRQKNLWVYRPDYDLGVQDAKKGCMRINDLPEGVDPLSWIIGYCDSLDDGGNRKRFIQTKLAQKVGDV